MNRPLTRAFTILLMLAAACSRDTAFDPQYLAVGPGGLVGNGEPLTSGDFEGGDDVLPPPREVATLPDDTRPPDCDGACVSYCNAANLRNPVNQGLCRSLWGVGLSHQPINHPEACRRLFVDVLGRLPTAEEADATCTGGWGATVKRMMDSPEFIAIAQRRAADKFLYSNEVVNIQAIYDMDRLVEKLYRGKVPYDLFAAVVSAHPVLTRRHADPGDKVEALFRLFLGRPPFEHEKPDMSRIYRAWHSGYYDHPQLGRMPDAYLKFPCLTEDKKAEDPVRKGECTSVLWGYHELIFTPDVRAATDRQINELTMWNGLLSPEEWAKVQLPGRVLSQELAFWERAVDDVLEQYLGYELSPKVPEVRAELVRWLLDHHGDIRSVHYAVLTSAVYLQSAFGTTATTYRWTHGPLKQMDAEVWIDSIARNTEYTTAGCDHRISQPELLLRSSSVAAYRVLQSSRWSLTDEGRVDTSYANLARTLGGCPENIVGGRFRVVSILTTGTQLAFVGDLCNPTLDADAKSAPIERLLPEGVDSGRALTQDLAGEIATYQYRTLLGRPPTGEELAEARAAGGQCAATRCNAEQFARPLCFALLTSAERLFY